MRSLALGATLVATTTLTPLAALAETEIQFWHAFTGRLGELVAEQVATFRELAADAGAEGWQEAATTE